MNNISQKTLYWILGILVIILVIIFLIPQFRSSNVNQTAKSDFPSLDSLTANPNGTTTTGTSNTGGTVTTPPAVVPPPSTIFSAPIAYIGCSNTWMYVDGYHSVGGTKFWPDEPSYTGQVITKWAADISSNTGAWRGFDSANAAEPGAKTLWVLPCAFPTDKEANVYSSLVTVIAEAKRRIPTIQSVYLSGLNSFENCTTAGPEGVAASDQAVAQAIKNGIGLPGPVMAYLSVAETQENGCHPLPGAPRNKEGQILLNFFK